MIKSIKVNKGCTRGGEKHMTQSGLPTELISFLNEMGITIGETKNEEECVNSYDEVVNMNDSDREDIYTSIGNVLKDLGWETNVTEEEEEDTTNDDDLLDGVLGMFYQMTGKHLSKEHENMIINEISELNKRDTNIEEEDLLKREFNNTDKELEMLKIQNAKLLKESAILENKIIGKEIEKLVKMNFVLANDMTEIDMLIAVGCEDTIVDRIRRSEMTELYFNNIEKLKEYTKRLDEIK